MEAFDDTKNDPYKVQNTTFNYFVITVSLN